jgi:hypothetical protein
MRFDLAEAAAPPRAVRAVPPVRPRSKRRR